MGQTTLLSVAHPWQCDQMNHMNVRFYSSLFDDAGFVLLGRLVGTDAPKSLGWADVSAQTEYVGETPAGTLLTITSTIRKIGRSSLSYDHVMTDSLTGEVKAKVSMVTVRFDLEARKSAPIEDAIRKRAEAFLD